MLVGGMLQAVDAYRSTNNLNIVDQVKRNILDIRKDKDIFCIPFYMLMFL